MKNNLLTQTQSPTHPPYFGLVLAYTFQVRIIWVENNNKKKIIQKPMQWQYVLEMYTYICKY